MTQQEIIERLAYLERLRAMLKQRATWPPAPGQLSQIGQLCREYDQLCNQLRLQ